MGVSELARGQRGHDCAQAVIPRALILLLLAFPAWGQTTPCPTVSNNVNILPVNVVGAPQPVSYSGYDIETGYLTVVFVSGSHAQMFVNVPRGQMQALKVQWASLQHFKQAVMQEKSTCPLLAQVATVTPILANP